MEGNSKPHAWKQVFMYPNILVEKIRMCLNVPGLQGAQSRKAVLWQAKICSYTTETSPSSRLKKKTKIFQQISPDPWSDCRSSLFRVTYCFSCSEVHFCAAVNTCTPLRESRVAQHSRVVTHGRNLSATVIIPLEFLRLCTQGWATQIRTHQSVALP